MTKKQMKEELLWNVRFNAEQAREWFRKCDAKKIENCEAEYRLYGEYQARAFETINIMETLGFITEAEGEELLSKTIKTTNEY